MIADLLRLDANRKLDGQRRAEMGQFLTPAGVGFMASLTEMRSTSVRILDAGAGVGPVLPLSL